MSMMDGLPDYCPRCDSWGFGDRKVQFNPGKPARPARLFSVARAARPASWTLECPFCDYRSDYSTLKQVADAAAPPLTGTPNE